MSESSDYPAESVAPSRRTLSVDLFQITLESLPPE